jgi:hypothetical protein
VRQVFSWRYRRKKGAIGEKWKVESGKWKVESGKVS